MSHKIQNSDIQRWGVLTITNVYGLKEAHGKHYTVFSRPKRKVTGVATMTPDRPSESPGITVSKVDDLIIVSQPVLIGLCSSGAIVDRKGQLLGHRKMNPLLCVDSPTDSELERLQVYLG